jgi:hypothetical protein
MVARIHVPNVHEEFEARTEPRPHGAVIVSYAGAPIDSSLNNRTNKLAGCLSYRRVTTESMGDLGRSAEMFTRPAIRSGGISASRFNETSP